MEAPNPPTGQIQELWLLIACSWVDLTDVLRVERILVQAPEQSETPEHPRPLPAGRFARFGSGPPSRGNLQAGGVRLVGVHHPGPAASKPKPRWDVHLPWVGKGAGSPAAALRPLIAGRCGSAVSPPLSGWTARRGNSRPSPLPGPWFPSTGFRWLPPSPSPRPPHRRLRPGCNPAEPALVKTGVHQPQAQAGCPQVLPHRLATVRRCVVPDHIQRPGVPLS